jgi:hypothetical protein
MAEIPHKGHVTPRGTPTAPAIKTQCEPHPHSRPKVPTQTTRHTLGKPARSAETCNRPHSARIIMHQPAEAARATEVLRSVQPSRQW